jgi:peroxiredoxin
VGPNPVDVAKASAGKKIVIFGLPGAFTPTCSNQHLPGYVKHAEKLQKAGAFWDLLMRSKCHDQSLFCGAGIDEIWCVSVNDAFVMGAWGREQKVLLGWMESN